MSHRALLPLEEINKMAYNNYNQEEKISHEQIIMQQMKRIAELSSHQLCSSDRFVMVDGDRQVLETEDTRISFIQSVEMLAYTLLPVFDEATEKFYNANIDYLQGFKSEIIEKITDEKYKEHLEKSSDQETLIIDWQVRTSKKLYVELLKLLKRKDFLKGSIYSEAEEELDLEGGE